MSDKYRDPIHGFIEVSSLENEIINSLPFQRLRNVKQLAMTYLVFHGAEHTRFGHSIGVMHLVTKSFRSAISNSAPFLAEDKKAWYEQILRIIALTHDLGHAPFSHASEAVFPQGLEHEVYTEKIVMETSISETIRRIGAEFVKKYGKNFDITPELICDIYRGRNPGDNSEFTFLKSFMDSELDCDKMDYLLRDSLYCGVNYGRFDVERLVACLTVHMQDGVNPRLAIKVGGIQAFEEFVLARYFMFVQVYFHRTRRYFDIMFAAALTKVLPEGKYPENTTEYIQWDDCRVLQKIKENQNRHNECCNIIQRNVYPNILQTKIHPEAGDKREFRLLRTQLYERFGEENFIEDYSADKMPHKIPKRTEVGEEKAIVIVDGRTGKCSTISEESNIIRNLSEKINIQRVYAKPLISGEVSAFVKERYRAISE